MIVVIASFGVVSALNLSVIDVTSRIGMLQAMGTTISSNRTIFVLQSGIMGLPGVLIGTFTGIIIALAIGQYEMSAASSELYGGLTTYSHYNPNRDNTGHYSCSFLLNLIAGIYPTQQAEKLDPVKAISSR